jgi:hypothetical protein
MSDILGRVMDEQDIFKKLLGKIPGFKGYVDRTNRRSADKLLRDTVSSRFAAFEQRISALQRDLISQGELSWVDDLEASAIKIRTFTDRVRTASYGYAGFFDAVKINSEELAQIYQYDLSLMQSGDEVERAIDNVEAAIGTDGLGATIRNLTRQAQKCIEAFDKRAEVILTGSQPAQS